MWRIRRVKPSPLSVPSWMNIMMVIVLLIILVGLPAIAFVSAQQATPTIDWTGCDQLVMARLNLPTMDGKQQTIAYQLGTACGDGKVQDR